MTAPKPVWGPWATLLWALLIAGVFIGLQAMVAGIYLHLSSLGLSAAEKQLHYQQTINDGDLLALVTIVAGLFGVGLTVVAASFKTGSNVRAYLGLYPLRGGQLLKWCLWFIVFLLALEILTVFMDYPDTTDFMGEVYQSANRKWLLFLAVVVVASLFEELFFRGFLLEGFRHTAIGSSGSVILTALLWSLLHVQYDAFGMASIFLIGLFLGVAKLRSGSTLLAMALHSLNNALAFFVLASLSEV